MFIILSMKIVSEMLESSERLTCNDLGFITTVFRDNSENDFMYHYYDSVLRFLIDFENTKLGG